MQFNKINIPPPIQLMRCFRCDHRDALPSVIQDALMDWSTRVPSSHLMRLRDILKNIQFSVEDMSIHQGKIWYSIRDILTKNLLDDKENYSDGRYIRSLVLNKLNFSIKKDSENELYFLKLRQELNIFSPRAKPKKIESD